MNISVEQMQMNATSAESLLKSLANSHRLMVLCHLVNGEMSVGELEKKKTRVVAIVVVTAFSQVARTTHRWFSQRRYNRAVSNRKTRKAMKVLETLYGIYC